MKPRIYYQNGTWVLEYHERPGPFYHYFGYTKEERYTIALAYHRKEYRHSFVGCLYSLMQKYNQSLINRFEIKKNPCAPPSSSFYRYIASAA